MVSIQDACLHFFAQVWWSNDRTTPLKLGGNVNARFPTEAICQLLHRNPSMTCSHRRGDVFSSSRRPIYFGGSYSRTTTGLRAPPEMCWVSLSTYGVVSPTLVDSLSAWNNRAGAMTPPSQFPLPIPLSEYHTRLTQTEAAFTWIP